MTRAPACTARSTVRSLDPPSTTTTSPTPWPLIAVTHAPIAVSSSRQGMMTETVERSGRGGELWGCIDLQAPAQAAAGAAFRRRAGLQLAAELAISGAV